LWRLQRAGLGLVGAAQDGVRPHRGRCIADFVHREAVAEGRGLEGRVGWFGRARPAAPTSTPSSSTPPSATPQHHMAFVPGDGRDKGRTLYVDAFNQGRIMDTADVENMFRRLGVREENLEQRLPRTHPRDLFARMLRNLVVAHRPPDDLVGLARWRAWWSGGRRCCCCACRSCVRFSEKRTKMPRCSSMRSRSTVTDGPLPLAYFILERRASSLCPPRVRTANLFPVPPPHPWTLGQFRSSPHVLLHPLHPDKIGLRLWVRIADSFRRVVT